MQPEDWDMPFARCLGGHFRGDGVLLLLNAHDGEIPFVLPGGAWRRALDTAAAPSDAVFESTYPLQARSLALLATK